MQTIKAEYDFFLSVEWNEERKNEREIQNWIEQLRVENRSGAKKWK